MSSDQMTHCLSNAADRPKPLDWREYYRVKWEQRAKNCPCLIKEPAQKQDLTQYAYKQYCTATRRACIQGDCPIDYWTRD